jgi:hypothetical protein
VDRNHLYVDADAGPDLFYLNAGGILHPVLISDSDDSSSSSDEDDFVPPAFKYRPLERREDCW